MLRVFVVLLGLAASSLSRTTTAALFALSAAGQTNTGAPPTLTSASLLPGTEFVKFLATDPDNNLSRAYFVINPTPTVQTNGCHGFYDYPQQRFFLYDDSLTTFVDEDSRCAIDRSRSAITPNGEVTLALIRKGPLPATKIFLWLTDTTNLGTGWLDPGLNLPQRTQQTPTISKGNPSSINSTSQQFSAQIEDLDGRFDLYRIYFLIDPTGFSIPQNTCHGFYDIATQATYLYNDALTAFSPNLENSQCALAPFTATPTSATAIQLTFTATRKGAYIGADLGIYLWAVDSANNGTGWQRTSSWIDRPNSPPRVFSSLRLLTGNPLTTSAAVIDQDGVSDIRRIYFLLAKDPAITTNGCHGFVDLAQNAVFLYNDALTAFAPNLENSQCAINGLGRISTTGSVLDWTATFTRRGAYKTGELNMYFWAVDNAGAGTGWAADFIWLLPNTQLPPALTSIFPTTTANATETFSLSATDPNGANELYRVYFLLNTNTGIPQNTCHGFYDVPTKAIYLYNDALTTLLGPLTPGTAGKLQNGQCAIDGAASSAIASGTLLALNLNLTRQGTYSTGVKDLYFWVVDSANTGTGWIRAATWTR
jgi:hypothetical protein